MKSLSLCGTGHQSPTCGPLDSRLTGSFARTGRHIITWDRLATDMATEVATDTTTITKAAPTTRDREGNPCPRLSGEPCSIAAPLLTVDVSGLPHRKGP